MSEITACLSNAKECIEKGKSIISVVIEKVEGIKEMIIEKWEEKKQIEDDLLKAFEGKSETSPQDDLISPITGMPYTDAEKVTLIQNAINREIVSLESAPPISTESQARIDELKEKSESINILHSDGINVIIHAGLVEDLGSPVMANAFAEMHGSSICKEANTATAILNGDIKVFNINDHISGTMWVDTDKNGKLDTEMQKVVPPYNTGGGYGFRFDSEGFNVMGTNEAWILDTNAKGKPLDQSRIIELFLHEGNHALNPPPNEYYTKYTPNERAEYNFEREFTAYWMSGEFDHVSEHKRDDAIRKHILKSNYYWAPDLDASGMATINAIQEPDPKKFNVYNSPSSINN